jgi:predicted  nucleic acid-binding Zn-ribbon protein
MLKLTESKFQSEIDRLQDQLIGVVTREDLKKVQDYMRNYNTEDINRLEIQCRGVQSSVDSLKHDMYNYVDEKLKSLESSAMRQSHLYSLKSEILSETERHIAKIKESYENNMKILGNELHELVESKVYNCEKTLADSIQIQSKDYKSIIKRLETQLNDSTHSLSHIENERYSYKQDLTNLVTEICDCRQNLADLSGQMGNYKQNLGNLNQEVESFKASLENFKEVKEDIGSLREELEECTYNHAKLESEIRSSKNEIEQQRSDMTSYMQNLELLRKNLSYAQEDTKRELVEIRDEMEEWDKRLNLDSMEKQINEIRKELLNVGNSKEFASKLKDLEDRLSKSIITQDVQKLAQEVQRVHLDKSKLEDRLNSYEERLFRLEAEDSADSIPQNFFGSESVPLENSSDPSSKRNSSKIQIIDNLSISQESGMSGENFQLNSGIKFDQGGRLKEVKPSLKDDSYRSMRYKDTDIERSVDTPKSLTNLQSPEIQKPQEAINLKSKLGPLVDFSKKETRVLVDSSPKNVQTAILDKKPEPDIKVLQPVSKSSRPDIIPNIQISTLHPPGHDSFKTNNPTPDIAFSDLVPSRDSQNHSMDFERSSSMINSEEESEPENKFNKVSSFNNKLQSLTSEKPKESSLKPNISIPSLDDYSDLLDSQKVVHPRMHKLSQDSHFSKGSIEFMPSSRSKSRSPLDHDEELENLADYLTEALLSEELGLGLDVIEDVAYRYIEQNNPELLEEQSNAFEYVEEITEEGSDISEDY